MSNCLIKTCIEFETNIKFNFKPLLKLNINFKGFQKKLKFFLESQKILFFDNITVNEFDILNKQKFNKIPIYKKLDYKISIIDGDKIFNYLKYFENKSNIVIPWDLIEYPTNIKFILENKLKQEINSFYPTKFIENILGLEYICVLPFNN